MSRVRPDRLDAFFTHAMETWPEALAVEVPPGPGRPARQTRTYAALFREVEALAARLRPYAGDDVLIALRLGRSSVSLYVAQLAVLRAGAAYVCIDPAFPDAQVQEILRDSGAVALLTDGLDLTPLSPLSEGPRSEPGGDSPLAYVIYTSGTTGKPKGVLIEHRSIVNLVHSDLAEFGLGPGDRVAQGSSPAYDSSVEEIWLALASGATVVVMDDDAARLGPDLIPWLQRERITVLCPPPTLLRTTGCDNPEAALPELRLLYVGGEALPRDIADRWGRGRRLVNGYGPTECTVTSLRGAVVPGAPITIGTPVPGLTACVLDDALQRVPDGVPGELCLGGLGLARGYHRRPEQTTEKFVDHPTLGRIYRTGDLVHRAPDGEFHYHGRLDAQVKLRGYRIELEAVEACLAQCPGVREAACTVQGSQLVAFVVPEDPDAVLDSGALKTALARALPAYMVPGAIATLAVLPKSVGGKLKRDSLPPLPVGPARRAGRPAVTPSERVLAAAFQSVLGLAEPPGLDEDFFHELGGTSLQAAQLVSHLRTDPATAAVTVRDIYDHRTVGDLAGRTLPLAAPEATRPPLPPVGEGMLLTGVVQSLWLLGELTLGSWLGYVGLFDLLPLLLRHIALVWLVFLLPLVAVVGIALYTPLAVLFAAGMKRLLIGRYTPRREPVWGGFYRRHWVVQQAARLIPWSILAGTEFQCVALRALGARIGQRVHLHRGVDLTQGGWDLLELGDDVTVSQDASLRLVDLADRQLVIGPIRVGSGATLDVRAGMEPDTVLEAGAYLSALSALPSRGRVPAGACWDGIPACPAGPSPEPPRLSPGPVLAPLTHGALLLLAQSLLWAVLALPLELLQVGAIAWYGLETQTWAGHLPVLVGLLVAALPLTLMLEALVVRALGRVPEGTISRWSLAYLRVWLKAGLVDSANEWLSGALFWPAWLRAAGMTIGRGCEISTVIDVVPELVTIGTETFFADGIYLGGPRVHRGTVTLARVEIGSQVFLGNHVVIAGGQRLPDELLLGVCTVADDRIMHRGTSWFGQPPFALPHREIVACDRRLTHEPTPLRYLDRLFWETLRFALPAAPSLVLYEGISSVALTTPRLAWLAAPLAALAGVGALCALIVGLKWLLLGRARPGTHPLWSCWCSRWDFLYVAWGQYARGTLTALEGTPLLLGYLRAVGLSLGRGVVLGSGFSQVVDPDMIVIGEGATVSAAFQAHTFEDRVLKLDRVRIERDATVCHNTVLLYGARIGEGARVGAHSVVMKAEELLPHRHYAGAPTRPQEPG